MLNEGQWSIIFNDRFNELSIKQGGYCEPAKVKRKRTEMFVFDILKNQNIL